MMERQMSDENTVTRGSGNVFADLGIPNATEHMMKANIVRVIAQMIEAQGLSQNQAAQVIGLAQPDVSKMLRGQFRGIGLERLLSFVRKLGSDVEIKVKTPDEKREGRMSLLVA
jgi:predicted XRE-type DNA-binding protein